MTKSDIRNEYFCWMYDLVCKDKYSDRISYVKLFNYLHSTEFEWLIKRDENRAADGVSLRYRFILDNRYKYIETFVTNALSGPCSVLEMMVALAIKCEEYIMDDPAYGNRTSQWFWEMIVSLGLGSMRDGSFDEHTVSEIVEKFMSREYSPNGKGGLFTIRSCDEDLRTMEIWFQMYAYLDTFI